MTEKEKKKIAKELINKGIIPIGDEIDTKTKWLKKGYKIENEYFHRPVYISNELFAYYGKTFRKKIEYYATYQTAKMNKFEKILDQKYIKIKSELYLMLIGYFLNNIRDEESEKTIIEFLQEKENK